MTTQLELAKHRLFSKRALDAADIKLFPGTSRDATSEDMAEQINKAMAQVESGDAEEVNPRDED
jgi:hypothetical protein